MKAIVYVIICFIFPLASISQVSQFKKVENIQYGMVSGTALLMDAYVPERSNHKAILFIPGSAFGYVYEDVYDQVQLKDDMVLDSVYMGRWGISLVESGYTVFVINHRFAPRYQYQDIIRDCQRAVRYIRYHANVYQIDPFYIGAMGHSSGGYLAALLGVSDVMPSAKVSSIDSVSSKVQAVVTLAAMFDLSDFNKAEDVHISNEYILSALEAYMGRLPEVKNGSFVLSGIYKDASPITHVTNDDAPALIYYSDDDPLIPARQSQAMYARLLENHVAAKIVLSPNAGHAPLPDITEIIGWFDLYLKVGDTGKR